MGRGKEAKALGRQSGATSGLARCDRAWTQRAPWRNTAVSEGSACPQKVAPFLGAARQALGRTQKTQATTLPCFTISREMCVPLEMEGLYVELEPLYQ